MKQKHLDKLYEILLSAFSAHMMAKWDVPKAREVIAKSIVGRFKGYLDLYEDKEK